MGKDLCSAIETVSKSWSTFLWSELGNELLLFDHLLVSEEGLRAIEGWSKVVIVTLSRQQFGSEDVTMV